MNAHPFESPSEARLSAFRSGDQTAEEIVAEVLEQIASTAWVNALVEVVPERALSAARQLDEKRREETRKVGPLAGLLFVVKDNIDARGWPTTACTPALANNVAASDAETVARLRQADAILLGKSVMHELAMGGTSNNPHCPPVRNPHMPDRIAGGSSGGTAAAIAAGWCDFGLGSDTGGSIPIPSALCGVAGLRPSVGRYSNGGLLMAHKSRDVIGPMAPTAFLLRMIDSVLCVEPPSPMSADLRLGLPRDYFWNGADRSVRDVLEGTIERLRGKGVSFVDLDLPDLEALNSAASVAFRSEPSFDLAESLAALPDPISIDILIKATQSKTIAAMLKEIVSGRGPRSLVDEALALHRPRLRNLLHRSLDDSGLDALVVPAIPLAAVPIGQEEEISINAVSRPFFSYTHSTLVAANAGVPFLTIPGGATPDGLPVGLGFIGRHGADAHLLAIGAACERLLT